MLLGREPAGIERVRDWVGNGSRVLVRRALAGQLDHDGVADELADEALALFMQAYAGGHELTAVYPGVRDCLDWLRERRVKLAIITNKPAQFIEPLLEEKGWPVTSIGWSVAIPCRSRNPTRRRCSG